MGLNIVMLTSGTRGDVQPLVALGTGLERAGHAVRIVTHEPFRALVAERGLRFTPLDGNPNELFRRPELRAALTYDGRPLRSAARALRFLRAARPVFERMLQSAWQGCQGADALIVSLPTTWGDQIAEALQIPCTWALTQPAGRTGAFPSPLQPFDLSLGPTYNRATHRAIEQLVWLPWRPILSRWRKATLRLPPLPSIGWAERTAARGDLFLYGVSPRVVPRPADWPARFHVTGYWFLDPPHGWQPPDDLCAFLDSGPPPLSVGFGGSGADADAALGELVLRAIAIAGRRAVVATAERAEPPASLPASIYPAGPVPHAWLFPRMAATVHHAGAGTVAEALRAGVPSVCMPFGADQFFWARHVAELRCGPPPVSRRGLTAERLAAAIDASLNDPIFRARAAAIGAQIAAERGVERAVALITSHVAGSSSRDGLALQ